MTVARDEFATFYAAANDGRTPFAWQQRLLDTLLDEGRWPDRIVAPTGAGKTSAIDVHVFANAATATDPDRRLPRRLVMVVGRRVLVDDQYERASALADLLSAASAGPPDAVLARVAHQLSALRWPARPNPIQRTGPLVVGRLRGGQLPSRGWRDHPTACAVLCATPDMWGSRLLFRGYGTSSLAAAREAGLLAYDAAVLVDEAHLSRQLLVTARRVAQLAPVAELPLTGIPALQVVETTATPSSGATNLRSVGVTEADLSEELLNARLTRPKPVSRVPVAKWPSRAPAKPVITTMVDAVRQLVQVPAAPGLSHTVGCFVNTVPTAIAVAEALSKPGSKTDTALRVIMICGQTRPIDLRRVRQHHPGLLAPQGSPGVDVIVSTQSLEVGVDLDLAAVVTELADGSALAQRAGRVNRRGLRSAGPLIVITSDGIGDKAQSGPYGHEVLREADQWLTERAQDPRGLSPWALREQPPPAASARRVLFQRPELADAWHWARTSDDLAARPELDLWLSESFDSDTSIGLVVRDAMPANDAEAIQLVRDLWPRRHEVFSVPMPTARLVLAEVLAGDAATPVVRVRGDDIAALPTVSAGQAGAVDLHPGDIVVVDSGAEIVTAAPHGAGAGIHFSPPVVVAGSQSDSPDALPPAGRGRADDVLHQFPDTPRPGQVVLRLELADSPATVSGLSTAATIRAVTEHLDEQTLLTESRPVDSVLRKQLRQALDALLADPAACGAEVRPMVEAAAELLAKRVRDSDVLLRRDQDGQLLRIVVIDRRRAVGDDELRQVFTDRDPGRGPVSLAEHQEAVGARAELLARHLGLSAELGEVLRLAGLHHDDGKADSRFQVRLGAEDGQLLAKSTPGSTVAQVRAREALTGLPPRWRHEQLSVAHAWPALHADAPDPLLAARLVGTSHGYGRSGFPLAADDLVPAAGATRELAVELFDHGLWDELVEGTHLRYGVWGCAYLEAVLRAADGQVSGEGS